ncbi:NmrA/HSCARG family protein [Polyangium jinanense]|uniref:NmrA/HSCARG family protein n=1 Tax=Polyangium jinanense TaxID=2829994 RepID=A0A9X3XIE6_9BACT|nr:NmrA/HSCARG family protein [Polyangium jinanense]MDC3961948.1 NmrA/HSCARG family protein [Polyangium jinanense]MDC3988651.1 NmrA/HSCARG family protein [Polyangium jinanense]
MSFTKRVIAVVGATGAQGGGLVRAIAAHPSGAFRARAITRNVNSTAAKELRALGAEIAFADLDDEASLRRAFEGAYGAYCVTFFWSHFSPERETKQARAMARAARATRVEHVIWSTIEDSRKWVPLSDDRMPTLRGKYKVPHTDAKGEADATFTELGVPTTFFHTSFYWENFLHLGMGPQRDGQGRLTLTLPMGTAKLPGIATEDIGRCAYGVFERGPAMIGQRLGVASDHLTGSELAAAFSAIAGEEVRYHAIEPEAYRRLDFPGADDLGNMFQFKRDFMADYCGLRDLARTRALNPNLRSFATWLAENQSRFVFPPRV